MTGQTNTLILAGISTADLEDANYINALQQELILNIPNTDLVQFIILKSFKRILLIFSSTESAIKMRKVFQRNHDFTTGFALNDYNDNINDNYLKLPNNSRMFLISPPASPPVDFDYHQTEEEPNKLQIYTHEELQEILLKNHEELREILESNQKETKYSKKALKSLEEFEKEIILNDSHSDNQPKIILHPIVGENDHLIGRAIQSFKTSLPPRSVFDDFSDNEEE